MNNTISNEISSIILVVSFQHLSVFSVKYVMKVHTLCIVVNVSHMLLSSTEDTKCDRDSYNVSLTIKFYYCELSIIARIE